MPIDEDEVREAPGPQRALVGGPCARRHGSLPRGLQQSELPAAALLDLRAAAMSFDLGCGEGTNTRLIARRGARMTGIDLSPQMIAAARAEEQRELARHHL